MTLGTFEDSRVRRATVGAIVVGLVFLALQLAVPARALDPWTFVWINDIGLVVLAGLVAGLAVWVSSCFDWSESQKLIWGLLALGALLWMAGEAFWAYYELILGQQAPYPSLADVGWAIGYLPFAISLFLRFGTLPRTPSTGRILSLLVIFAILLVLVIIFLIWPIVTYPDYDQPIEQFLDVLYPVGDLVIAFAGLLVVMTLFGGTLSRSWLLIAVGFLVVAVADLFYTYGEWEEIYTTTGENLVSAMANTGYIFAYIVMAVGIYIQARIQRIA